MALKKLFLFTLFLISLLPFTLSAQNNSPFTIKVGAGITEDEPLVYPSGFKERFDKAPLFSLEFGYEMFPNFDVSLYGGYAKYMRITRFIIGENYSEFGRSGCNAVFYGLRGKYDVLPLIMKSDLPLRFELYPIATIGAVTSIWTNSIGGGTTKASPYFECSIGVGGGFRITRGFGLYFEYGFGRYFSKTMQRLQGGLTFHF